MTVTREAGRLGVVGLYVTGDPGAKDDAAKEGSLSIRIGLGWAKSHSFTTGQCPVMSLPPPADERDPQRALPDRQGCQRHGDLPRRCAVDAADLDLGTRQQPLREAFRLGAIGGRPRATRSPMVVAFPVGEPALELAPRVVKRFVESPR